MGSPNYSAPAPESTANVLNSYSQYLPGLIQGTAAQTPDVAAQQLAATQQTAGPYNALNLQQAQQYGVPLAQVGQQITNSNALAGAQTNLNQLQGPGGQAAQSAYQLAQQTNPNYYNVQNPASSQAANLLNSINLNGLSPGEQNAVERSLNQSNVATNNLGLDNATNAVSNAVNFGGAFNQKLGILGSALGAANQTANTAQNTGFSPVNIALGQPNTSTMSNFGTGTFSNTTPATQNAASSNALGYGTSMLGNMSSMNNAQTSTQGTFAGAQANLMGSLNPCCFIFLETYSGKLPWFVRKCRDKYYGKVPEVARGYKKMAKWLVPLMRKNRLIRFIVWRWMVEPLTQYGGWLHRIPRYEDGKMFKSYRTFWFTLWRLYGRF